MTEHFGMPSGDVPDVVVVSVDQLRRSGKVAVPYGEEAAVAVFWNNGDPTALDDKCIHRGRSLVEGQIFNGRAVCPGHQWSFDLHTGYCREREKFQPAYQVTMEGDVVEVCLSVRLDIIASSSSDA